MQWYFLAAGVVLLAAAVILTVLLRRLAASSVLYAYRRPQLPSRLIPLLYRTVEVPLANTPALNTELRMLLAHVIQIQQRIAGCPALPIGYGDQPRIMSAAEALLDEEALSSTALQKALSPSRVDALCPSEAAYFPTCVEIAQCRRLQRLLTQMLQQTNERARPDVSSESAAAYAIERELHFAEQIRLAEECFSALSKLNWLPCCEVIDPLHHLLLDDPSGHYPRMDVAARLQLRLQIEFFARRAHMDPETVLHHARQLCEEAVPDSLEAYIGYWFQDASGMRKLQKRLPTARGWLYAMFARRRDAVRYALCLLFGLMSGSIFLQSGQPVFMLPFFALCIGCIIRDVLLRMKAPALPAINISTMHAELRTLVVLPALLKDIHDAIRQVRQLKILRHTFPEDYADFLLLGDFADNMTAVSSHDAAIIQGAASAIDALADSRCHYLQRGRTWHPDGHTYTARGSRRGAVTAICRLITQGECEDPIAFSTFEPTSFERKYAYVLVLGNDVRPAPGMLEALLRVITHPMCSRYPAADGWRGYSVLSPDDSPLFTGVGLIRPAAYLEATEGLVYDAHDADAICGELAGHAAVPCAYLDAESPDQTWEVLYRTSRQRWLHAQWQLPWVQTPSGLIRNPLKHPSRFRLREALREILTPLGQCVLLLWATLTGSWLLFALAIAAPEFMHPPRHMREWLPRLCRLSLLPTRAILPLQALLDLLLKKSAPRSFVTLEAWAQGIFATIMIALGFAFPEMAVPALAAGTLFACFPLAHRYESGQRRSTKGLTEEHATLLEQIATNTWRYMRENTSHKHCALPPCSVQFDPPAGSESATSPEAIAASLLSCICAKEMEFISANDAAARLQRTLSDIGKLPLPFGLPCRKYALPSLTVLDARVDAAGTGLLLAALMTTAQALRTWLPELDSHFLDLSAVAEQLAASFKLDALYDAEADLIYRQLDENGQGIGHVTLLTDEALVLSVAACARKQIPTQHFRQLSNACVRMQGADIPLSLTGNASAYLLARLFVSMPDADALHYISAMQEQGHQGLWGQDQCGYFSFDPSLHYREQRYGVPTCALTSTDVKPVYTPYAATLCLPFAPHAAAEVLLRYHSLGAFGPSGMCDAVDFTQGQAIVGRHDTLHQGIILMSIAHVLADAPIQRYFSALPQVEAVLPLLHARKPPLTLPALSAPTAVAETSASTGRDADPLLMPPELHLTGTADFRIMTDTWGNSVLYDHATPLTRFDPASKLPQGVQLYLADEGRVYRIGDPLLASKIHFSPGETLMEQHCGSLKAELVTLADTLRYRALHILTITNLSSLDRVIDAADCLLPDLSVPANTLEVQRPQVHRLLLRARGNGRTLHHTVSCSQPPLAMTVCTDAPAFLGRGRTLYNPASLEEASADLLALSAEPCLSFRVRLTLASRVQATIWFTTSLQEHEPPQLSALPGLRQLARFQHEAIDAAIPLDDTLRECLRLLLPPLFQAKHRILLHISTDDDASELPQLASCLDWLLLHGVQPEVWIICPGNTWSSIHHILADHACKDRITLSEDASPPNWCDALVLRGDASLCSQLDALYTRIQPPTTHSRPLPALLPKAHLEHRSTYGGFDPHTGDYLIELEPGMTTPASWENTHVTRFFRETVCDSGFLAPFAEKIWLTLPDGSTFSPWSPALPRSIRMSSGMTHWETWCDQLDLRLSAACMPGHSCGLRVLRLRNATDAPLEIRLTVQATLGNVQLDCTDGVVTGEPNHKGRCPYLAGEGWTSQAITPNPLSLPNAPPDALSSHGNGRYAQLITTLTLPPQGNGEACWLSGFARHAGDIAQALDALRQEGKSALLRAIQSRHAQPLNHLTVSTPEDTFDLLMNSILPRQALCSEGTAAIPALLYLAPHRAKWRLLETIRRIQTRDEWARMALHIDRYTRATGDMTLPGVWLSQQYKTIFAACKDALLSLPLDHRGLPLGSDSDFRCFLFALAAQALTHCTPDPELAEFSRKLLNAADTYLWDDICYGKPLRADVQALSCLAYGANPRTRQAMRTAWMTLYDPFHGLIRRRKPDDSPALPGLPENGGMITTDAILTLRALLITAHHTEAHELMRALNPIHHCDDPQRMETFRSAPYQLHGGMHAAPLEAGRAVSHGGAEAAAHLYAILLEDVLGLHREGNTLHFTPHVPPEWDDYTLTFREGSATWHISVEKSAKALTIDGEESTHPFVTLLDDGRIHQVRIPLK